MQILEGNCYIFGPHVDGLYSVEKVARILDGQIIISYFRGNAHQQRHIPEEVIAEVGCNCEKDWFYPKDLGKDEVSSRREGDAIFTKREHILKLMKKG